MAAATVKDSTGPLIEPGKVGEVRNRWLLQGDEELAHRMQNEEFGAKYDWNRAERRTARTDAPLARIVQTEEEKRLELEQLERLEREKQRLDDDARIALQLEKEERMRKDLEHIENNDKLLAREMQRQESQHIERTQDDALLALQMQREEVLRKRNEAKQREMEDQKFAHRLQQREQQLAEMVRIERELQQQQRSVNNPQVVLTDAGYRQGNVLHRQLQLADEDEAFGSEDSHYDALYAQDKDMARELQQLEIEQAKATRTAARDRAYDVASSDARLARIMQEQERLDAIRRAEERRIRRLQRQQMEQQMEQQLVILDRNDMIVVPTPPPYDPRSPATAAAAGHHHHNRPPVNRAYSAQCNRVGAVSEMPPRSSHSIPVSPRPVLPADFLRYDQTSQNDFEDGVNSSSDRHDRSVNLPPSRPNAVPTRSQSIAENNAEPQLPRQRAKRSESTKTCKQQ